MRCWQTFFLIQFIMKKYIKQIFNKKQNVTLDKKTTMKYSLSDSEFEKLHDISLSNLETIHQESEKLLDSLNNSIIRTINKSYTLMFFQFTVLSYSFKQVVSNYNSYYILLIGLLFSFILLLKNIYVRDIYFKGFSPNRLLEGNTDKDKYMKISIIDNIQNSVSSYKKIIEVIVYNFGISFKSTLISFLVFFLFIVLTKSNCFYSYISSLDYYFFNFIFLFIGVIIGIIIRVFTHKITGL